MTIGEKLLAIAENEQRVFDAGKQTEYDRFWDNYQDNGNRTNYVYAFARLWPVECYDPKYPITCTGKGGDMIFYNNTNIIDTKVPITLDTSANQTLFWCTALKKTHIIVNKDTKFNLTFQKCESLEELYIYGTIGQNGFNVLQCPLDSDSVSRIATVLEDKSGDTSGTDWVVTLGAANIATAGTGNLQDITQKGWRYE